MRKLPDRALDRVGIRTYHRKSAELKHHPLGQSILTVRTELANQLAQLHQSQGRTDRFNPQITGRRNA